MIRILETAKFAKLRRRIRDRAELEALKTAIGEIRRDPLIGKKLKGELENLRSYAYHVRGQARRLIFLWEKEDLVLFSFGPRQGIYK
jgi:mRNA-degrading endonuclease RelE of RelBE toxin-antitoxin system